MYHHSKCPQLCIRAAIEHIDVEEEEFGELKHASLTLRGKLFRATSSWKDSSMGVLKLVQPTEGVTETLTNPDDFSLHVDDLSFIYGQQRELIFMALYDCDCVGRGEQSERVIGALVLKESTGDPGKYERFGVFQFKNHGYDSYTIHETEHSLELI